MKTYDLPNGDTVAFNEDDHTYFLLTEDEAVPLESVTQTLGAMPKPGLPWWGMKVGVAGALKLLEYGVIEREVGGEGVITTPEDAVDLLSFHKLTVNHVRDDAAQRGTDVHDIAEALANGDLPDLDAVDPERRGYAQALVSAWLDLSPEVEAVEVVVASKQLGVAGKFDLRARIPEGRTAVVDAESGWREPVLPGTWLLDYKTSSGVYESHVLQLEAYDGLGVHCGYEACDELGVIRLCEDGRYELVTSWAVWDDYVATVGFFRTLEKVKRQRPKRPRKCQRAEHYFRPTGRERICEECR